MHSEITRMFDLRGQVALVTGGATNLGFDAACVLAAAGCDVAITSRDLERCKTSAEQLRGEYGVDVLPLCMDQTDNAQIVEAANAVGRWKQRIDILVNNAGGAVGSNVARLFDRDPKDIERLISVNLTGMIYCCREAGRIMAEQRRGKIVNIASIAGLVGRDRRMYERSGMNGPPVDYAAAKAGAIGFTRDLAGYLSPMGINVNSILPGGFSRNLPEQFERDYSDRTPVGRMGRDGIALKGAGRQATREACPGGVRFRRGQSAADRSGLPKTGVAARGARRRGAWRARSRRARNTRRGTLRFLGGASLREPHAEARAHRSTAVQWNW